jgi:hypothetical protein
MLVSVSTRTRWIATVSGLAIMIVVITVIVERSDRGPKTWIIRPGEELTLSADEVHPDDVYRCRGKGKGASMGRPSPDTASSAAATSASRPTLAARSTSIAILDHQGISKYLYL